MSDVVVGEVEKTEKTVKIVYILYLVGIILGITTLIGLIMAYINKKNAPDWLQTHYRFQIRTFWIGFLYSFIGVILSPVVIGYFILLFVLIWLIVRCVKGLKYLGQKEPYPNPTTWLF